MSELTGETYIDMCNQINWFRTRVAQLKDELARLQDENIVLRKRIAEMRAGYNSHSDIG